MNAVAVIGLGYVGLTVAVALARRGLTVFGVDHSPTVVATLREGRSHLYEPGVEDALREHLGHRLFVGDAVPREPVDAAIICVSTPVDAVTHAPKLDFLRDAARAVAAAWPAAPPLVVVRSTVPVGTTRAVVLPELAARASRVRLAFCPERTIQGQALRELEELPQVVGGLDDASADAAESLFARLTRRTVRVASLEAAELVKLINNCHTDLIYAFGNEVALFAERFGVDPLEAIRAANVDYPRPDLAKPGFVGGACLSKDPYMLLASGTGGGHRAWLVDRARALNEYLPEHVARHFLRMLAETRGTLDGARVLVLGFAYKGWPPTDDMRGSPTPPILDVLRGSAVTLLGHDFLVADSVLRGLGVVPCDPDQGFAESDAVLVVTDHPEYARLDVEKLVRTLRRPALVYDCWRILGEERVRSVPNVRYAGIGYG